MAYSIDDTIILISDEVTSQDDLGQEITEAVRTPVFCKVTSASRAEFYQATQTGLRASYTFTINAVNYSGQNRAEYHGATFAIYRTYRRSLDEVELYAAPEVQAYEQ